MKLKRIARMMNRVESETSVFLNTIVEFRSEEMRKLRGNEWNAVLVMYSKINE